MRKILLLHGPNLNLLGRREPEIYGHDTLDQINARLAHHAEAMGATLETFQTQAEHEMLTKIHAAITDGIEFIIINPAAWSHTSIALRDALLGVGIPYIEVHLSNIYARETFRQQSYCADKAVGVICGLGAYGYQCALHAAIHYLETEVSNGHS